MNRTFFRISALGLALAIVFFGIAGCTSQTPALGWSGMIVVDGRLFATTMKGELLELNTTDATQQQAVLAPSTGGGFLGCAASASGVASYGMPTFDSGNVYVTGYNGKVYRFAVATGALSNGAVGSSKPIVGGAVASGGKVFLGSSDGSLYALDGSTLTSLWSFKTKSQIWSTPALANGFLYFGSFDKNIYAVNAASGTSAWSFPTQGAIVATPVVAGQRIYVASFDEHIYALDAGTGSLIWQYPAAGQSTGAPASWFWATPVLAGDILLAPCMDHNLYALNAKDGSLAYTLDLKAPVISTPVVTNGRVVVANQTGTVFSFDAANGQGLKSVDLRQIGDLAVNKNLKVNASLVAAGGSVFVHSMTPEYIYSVDPANMATPNKVWDAASPSNVSTPSVTTVTAPPSVITVTATVTTVTK